MNARIFFYCISVLTLSGCSSLNRLLTFQDEVPPAQVAAATEVPAQPAATVPGAQNDAPSEWCQRVAASDRLRAQQAGFDAATLDRMTLQSLRQCATLGPR
jgi:hypothetical protein